MKQQVFFPFIAVLLILGIASQSLADSNKSKEIKFGVVLSLTGDAANNGEAMRKGVELAVKELRRDGWVVNVDYQDDETKPAKTLSAVKFLLRDNYKYFIGPTWSFLIKSVKATLEKENALAIAPAGSSDINGGSSSAILNLCPKREKELQVVSLWLKDRSIKNAYLLVPIGDWGEAHRKVFYESAKSLGVNVVGIDEFDYGNEPTTFKSFILKAKSLRADAILTTATGSDTSAILKYRSEMKVNIPVLTTEDLWDAIDSGLISNDDKRLDGVYVVGLPLNKEFSIKFMERFKENPKIYADRAYDAVMLLAKAELEKKSHQSVRDYLLTDSVSYTGVTGTIKFNQLGDRVDEDFKTMVAINNPNRN